MPKLIKHIVLTLAVTCLLLAAVPYMLFLMGEWLWVKNFRQFRFGKWPRIHLRGQPLASASIVFFNRPFYPNEQATSVLLLDLSMHLAKLTPVGVMCNTAPSKVELVTNPAICRCYWPSGLKEDNGWRKLLNYYHSFLTMIICASTLSRKQKIVLCTDPPLLDSILGAWCNLWRKPWNLILFDWYPEILFRMQFFRSLFLRALCQKIQIKIFRHASNIIAISTDMSQILQQQGLRNIATIENWAPQAIVAFESRETENHDGVHQFSEKLVLKYAGNFGPGCDLALIAQALPLLNHSQHLRLVFQGDGRYRRQIEELAGCYPFVEILPWVPRKKSRAAMEDCDAHLITLPAALFGVAFPSKCYQALAVGKPVLTCADPRSELYRLPKLLNCGLAANAHDPRDLARVIDQMIKLKLENPQELCAMAQAAKKYSVERWNAVKAAEKYAEIFGIRI